MCYSGKCIWEQYTGDCGFPTIKAVRDKYPLPICEIGDETEEEQEKTRIAIADVKQIMSEHGKEKNNISRNLQ